jgi:Spy/CpxP family protein refolding chaperone
MKSYALCAITLLLMCTITKAQPGGPPPGQEDRKEQVESMKIAYITTKLDLTPEEAQVFWPVYNQYRSELDKIREGRRKDMKSAGDDFSGMSDAELEKFVDGEVAFRQSELDVMKKYHSQFKKVLPIRKVAKLYRAEEDFKRELLKRMQHDRRDGGSPPSKK